VGGFHLMHETDTSRLSRLAERLMELPATYYTGHCTGDFAFATMKPHMGDRLQRFSTGDCLIL
jgi:7,8-dihydropterin-6-yl-methyl-4-(beta-D-ribofuranosyl)aminobenzene 5'-phosphate synthase